MVIVLISIYWLVAIVATYCIRQYNQKTDLGYILLVKQNKSSIKRIEEHVLVWLFAPLVFPIGGFISLIKVIRKKKSMEGSRGVENLDKTDERQELKLTYEYNIPNSLHTEVSQKLGDAIISGDFSQLESLFNDEVSTILYGRRTIYGKEAVISYWRGWKERHVDSGKVRDVSVVNSNYYSNASLKLDGMVVLFHIKENKVDKIVFSGIDIAPVTPSFHVNLLTDLPFDYEYIKKRLEPLRKSNEVIEPVVKEHRLPCMCCGSPSEALEWHSCTIYAGIHGYRAQVSICPTCGKVVEFYPEIRLRFEEPQIAECDLMDEYARCWNNKNIDKLSICLSDDFHYSSAWVFKELGKEEYLKYFEGKLEKIKQTGSTVHAEVRGGLIVVSQDGKNVVIDVKIENGKIVRADMTFPSLYGIPEESQNNPPVRSRLYGLRSWCGDDCLKNTRYVESLPDDEIMDFREEPFMNMSELGPCSTRQIASDSNWLMIGRLYDRSFESYNRVKHCFQEALDDGMTEAANNLGIFEYNFEENYEIGEKLFRLAAEKGSYGAMINLFAALWNQSRYRDAVDWLLVVSQKDSPSMKCLFNLAYLYFQGDSYPNNPLPQNIDKAIEILKRASVIDMSSLEEDERCVISAAKQYLDYIKSANPFSVKGSKYHDLLCNSACKTMGLKDKGELFYELDMLKLDSGLKLGIRLAERQEDSLGDTSSFYVYDEEGKEDKDIIKHLSVTPTQMGAWQVYLLMTSNTVMPTWWHDINRKYVFGESDLAGIEPLKSYDLSGITNRYDVIPKVDLEEVDGTLKADINCCYWNDWKGLMLEHACVKVHQGRVESFEIINETVLYDPSAFYGYYF